MCADKDKEQEIYWNEEGGQRWVRYIDHMETILAGFSARLLSAVAATAGEHVLDIGCGGGITSAELARKVGPAGSVLGVDISRVILDVARARYADTANLRFETADAARHSFAPASFDLLCSRFGVMFFPDPVAAFTNIRRAARATARLQFMCWRGLQENPWMGAVATAAFAIIGTPPKPEPGAPGPFSFAKPERVEGILKSAGFGDIGFEAVDLPMHMGTVDTALEWLTNMGPASQPLREASDSGRAEARVAMRKVLDENARDGKVVLPGATWIVSARPA